MRGSWSPLASWWYLSMSACTITRGISRCAQYFFPLNQILRNLPGLFTGFFNPSGNYVVNQILCNYINFELWVNYVNLYLYLVEGENCNQCLGYKWAYEWLTFAAWYCCVKWSCKRGNAPIHVNGDNFGHNWFTSCCLDVQPVTYLPPPRFLYSIQVFSIDSAKMGGNFPAVLNYCNQILEKLNQLICN